MNTKFSINRLGLLLKRYFIENKQRQLSAWGIIIFVFMIMHRSGSAEMFLYIYGFIFAAGMFKIFNYTPGGMHYLLIPATHAEKLTASILISTVYCFLMVLSCYTIGVTLGTIGANLIFGTNNPIQFELFKFSQTDPMNLIHQINIWTVFTTFTIIQSVFLLGSLYFKRNAIGKTMLSIIGFWIVLFIIELFLLKFIFGKFSLNITDTNHTLLASFGRNNYLIEYVFKVLGYLSIPFLWTVSYFRLTEKEV